MLSVLDTTLRDGQQREGVHLTLEDKLRTVARLDAAGLPYIEAGFPASNPVDAALFAEYAAGRVALRQARLVAFGITRRKNSAVEEDEQLSYLAACAAPAVTLVGKAWSRQVELVLETDAEENLAMVAESVAFLVAAGKQVLFDAEHYFDGYREDPAFALAVLRAAAAAGADVLVLCDTNGGLLPQQVSQMVRETREALAGGGAVPVGAATEPRAAAGATHATASELSAAAAATGVRSGAGAGSLPVAASSAAVKLGIHTHNDSGCAVANALEAVRAGAQMVQGTVNGYGERAGNADLIALLANLELKLNYEVIGAQHLRSLTALSQYVAEVFNIAPDAHQPYVGASAFAHKGGLHASATARLRDAYEHVRPELIGNFTHIVVSELAGKASLQSKAAELGVALPGDESELNSLLSHVKAREEHGYSYEAADASLALLLLSETGSPWQVFRLEGFRVIAEKRADGAVLTEATIKIFVDGERHIATAEGNGPVNALDQALRMALGRFYPQINLLRLSDYKVRVLDESIGTSAVTRVGIETTDGEHSWGTVGVSENIIEASWDALVDSITYGLLK
ncbi:MAG: citramalate synthase [Coriobacteriales bacterium]|jgi:2-isopropylmalate synthase|nr:citramalate synthase [Coriobacteriales bacterium]